jgi:cytoskeleton protein RodZ
MAAREEQKISRREAADMLNWMPEYVAIVEQNNYSALRRPSFARGYVKAFGRLVGLDEERLMTAFDALENQADVAPDIAIKAPRTPLQLQKTGLGVVVGLGALFLLIAALWWWQGTV